MEWMFMPYRRYFDFNGRSCRKEYWMYVLLLLIIYAVLGGAIAAQVPLSQMMDGTPLANIRDFKPGFGLFVPSVLLGGIMLGSLIPGLAVTVRRFHDQNMSGWILVVFLVIKMIPYVGWLGTIANLVLMARRGTAGANRYGADPLDTAVASVFE